MTENPILKKMRLKPDQKIMVLNAPDGSWNELFADINQETGKTLDSLILFAENQKILQNSIEKAKKLLNAKGTVWVAFPKGTSKLKTDLSRDSVLGLIPDDEWKFLTLISLDKDWSAFAFRLKTEEDRVKEKSRKPAAEKETDNYINMLTREIMLPEDLETVLDSDKKAKAYFDKLAFSHRKEYVLWITEAKKPETRLRRLEKILNMLNQGAKSPQDKTTVLN